MNPGDSPPPVVRRIRRISPLQFGKVSGLCYFIIGLVFVPFILIAGFVGSHLGAHQPAGGQLPFAFGGMFAVILPFLYGFFGLVFGIIGAAIYNLIAGWVGGIEVQVV